ncbi:MAG: hypothetical protein JWR38_5340 [Mucilaginibacter sp.]|nr:hypothetical protein [Mucilaginibacter sp.]
MVCMEHPGLIKAIGMVNLLLFFNKKAHKLCGN